MLNATMMDAIIRNEEGKIEFRRMPVPELDEDDILVKVRAAGICGGDLHVYQGHFPQRSKEPVIQGHEFCGEIVALGSRVNPRWKTGMRVVSENTAYACGVCPSCSAGNFVNCRERRTIGVHSGGGFAEYVKIPGYMLRLYPNCLMELPESVSFEEGACMEPAANAYKAIIQEGELRPGQNVVIFGPGSLGLMAVQHAAIAGSVKIIVVGLAADKQMRFKIAQRYGATHCLASDEEVDILGKIEEIAGPGGIDLALDVVGAPPVTHMAIECVRNEGRVVFVGDSFKPYNYNLNTIGARSLTFRGHKGYNAESWRMCLALTGAGKFDLSPLITAELPLAEFEKGYAMMIKQEAGKVVLIP